MKLISLHIENFGKLTSFDYDFKDNISCISEENGYGKTTLSWFLRAMLYGLGDNRGSNNRYRKRFAPFNKGAYGGNLVFESQGEEYRLERFFSPNRPSEDTMLLYRNGRPVEISDEPGRYFFGIEEESFAITAFLSGSDLYMKPTETISGKLNLFAGGTESGSLQNAIKKLEDESNLYSRSRAKTGLIPEKKEEASLVRERLEIAKAASAELPLKIEEYRRLEKELEEASKAAEKSGEALRRNDNLKTLEEMEGEAESLKRKIEEAEEAHPSGFPEEARLKSAEEAAYVLSVPSNLPSLSFREQEHLSSLEKTFEVGVPLDGDLIETKAKIDAFSKETRLSEGSVEPYPDEATAEEIRRLGENLKVQKVPETKNKGKLLLGLRIGATIALLMALGGAITIYFQAIAGYTLLGVGGLAFFILMLFMYRIQTKEKPAEPPSNDKNRLDELLSRFGFPPGTDAAYALSRLEERWQKAKELEDHKKEAGRLETEIRSFFTRFGLLDTDYLSSLTDLKFMLREYRSLLGRKEDVDRERKQDEERRENLKATLASFANEYGLGEATLDSIRNLRDLGKEYASQKQALSALLEKIDSFKKEKGLEGETDMAEAEAPGSYDVTKISRDLAILAQEIEKDQESASSYRELEDRSKELKEEIEGYKKTQEALENAKLYLKKADEAIRDRYIKPLREQFSAIAGALDPKLADKASLSADLEVVFSEAGALRGEAHLSSGERTLLYFGLRLALLRNMYPGEKPFLVLDDPFSSLDEEHFQAAKKALPELSKGFQILYLSCHPSRDI